MRDFRRLPPFLRIVSVVGLLFIIGSLILFVANFFAFLVFHMSFHPAILLALEPPYDFRALVISVNLCLLSLACSAVVNTYTRRFRQPDQGPLPLSSWRSQARWLALIGALPLCAIILALAISPAATLFGLVFGVSLLGALLFLGAFLAMISPASPVLRA